MTRRPLLRPDLQKNWEALDQMPDGSIVIDEFGHAWQKGFPGYWYCAYDGEGISDFALAQATETIRQVTP